MVDNIDIIILLWLLCNLHNKLVKKENFVLTMIKLFYLIFFIFSKSQTLFFLKKPILYKKLIYYFSLNSKLLKKNCISNFIVPFFMLNIISFYCYLAFVVATQSSIDVISTKHAKNISLWVSKNVHADYCALSLI